MVIVLPLIAFFLGLCLGWVLFAQRLTVVLWTAAVALLGAMGWAIWMGRQAQGFDGIGFAIFAVLMCLPALIGLGAGGLGGLWRRRRAAQS
jgi:hypothetical protein